MSWDGSETWTLPAAVLSASAGSGARVNVKGGKSYKYIFYYTSGSGDLELKVSALMAMGKRWLKRNAINAQYHAIFCRKTSVH